MNFIDIANEILKMSLKHFKETNSRDIPVNDIYQMFSDVDDNVINDAFRKLSEDGIAINRWASNKVYLSELQMDAIINNFDKSRLESVYTILKEVRDWIPGY